jgi:glutamyl-tRNA synthetase
MSSPVRTRFAPSPTGFAHVGNVRTALFAFLVAHRGGGKFVLRLEDTDKKREVAGADDYILQAVKSLGLNYDEGPDVGGPYAPYRQSERLEVYKVWAQKLIASGRAYADPYTPEEVQKFRDEATAAKKPFLYRNHRPENPPMWDGSQPLRFKSEPKDYHWHDAVMGDLSAGAEAVDDFILIKSDGYPTYNFAHIVDDSEMKISHIIRGQEFVASTPNYLNLYEALELAPPIFATVPHILNEAGNKKLGKRDGAKDVMEYLREGFLPEALVNFIASLGWNDGTEQEVFSLDELIVKFSLGRVGKSGARFDERRLIWLNGQWIKKLSIDKLYSLVIASGAKQSSNELLTTGSRRFARDDSHKEGSFWGENGTKADENRQREVLTLVQDRLKTLSDLPSLSEYFFARPEPNWQMVDDNKQLKKLSRTDQIELLKTAESALSKMETTDWQTETLQSKLNELLETTAQKPPVLFGIIRFALTWAPFSPSLPETMQLLGKTETLARLQSALKFTQ